MEKITKVAGGEYAVYYLTDSGSAYTYIWNQDVYNTIITKIGVPHIVDIAYGLHNGLCVDISGSVWTYNDNTYGQQGSGITGSNSAIPYKVVRDSNNKPFNNVTNVYCFFGTNIAKKSDNTIWIWGQDIYNMFGNNIVYPTQISIPAGVIITKLVSQNPLLGLDSTGGVWEWKGGKGNLLPTKVQLPSPSQDIAAVAYKVSYALINGYPYGWGSEGAYMGVTGSNGYWNPVTTPISLKSVWGLTNPITQIVGNDNTTHFIDVSGSLWGLGDNAMGEVGNGQELNYTTYVGTGGPAPYAWDWAKYELMVLKPIKIATETKFKQICTNNSDTFYVYAQDTNDNWYSWGRNKGAVLGNGAMLNSQDGSSYPNLVDVTKPTYVTPLTTVVTNLVTIKVNGLPIVTNMPSGSVLPPPPVVLPKAIITIYDNGTWKYN